MPSPPKWVPGPHVPTRQPPGIPTQSLPSVRYWTTTAGESLKGIAERQYGNGAEAVRIFQANMKGKLRDDRTPGFLTNMDTPLPGGTVLIIP